MAEIVESELCRTGQHLTCHGCRGCGCHPGHRDPEVWPRAEDGPALVPSRPRPY